VMKMHVGDTCRCGNWGQLWPTTQTHA